MHQNGLRYRHDPLGDRRRGMPITLCVGSLEPVVPGHVIDSLPGYSRQELRDARTAALFDIEQHQAPNVEARPRLTAVA